MNVDIGVRDSGLVVPEGVVGSFQVADLQITQRLKVLQLPHMGIQ